MRGTPSAASPASSLVPSPPNARSLVAGAVLAAGLLVVGCSSPEATRSAAPAAVTPSPGASPGSASAEAAPLVVFLGDSLTAGYGLDEAQAYPALIEETLRAKGLSLRVVNAGISGDTTAGGLARVDWVLRQQPDVVVVALGANDGLRGAPVEAAEENLRRILRRVLDAGARPILAGMRLPPNYGPAYERDFSGIFPKLADELEVPLIPFLLQGVGGDRDLNLPDGIHPNAAGQKILAETVAPYVESALGSLAS